MYKNGRIQDYANSNPGQLVQKLISAKDRTRQIKNVYSMLSNKKNLKSLSFYKVKIVNYLDCDFLLFNEVSFPGGNSAGFVRLPQFL